VAIRRNKTEKKKIRNIREEGLGSKAVGKLPSSGTTECPIVWSGLLLGCPKYIDAGVVC